MTGLPVPPIPPPARLTRLRSRPEVVGELVDGLLHQVDHRGEVACGHAVVEDATLVVDDDVDVERTAVHADGVTGAHLDSMAAVLDLPDIGHGPCLVRVGGRQQFIGPRSQRRPYGFGCDGAPEESAIGHGTASSPGCWQFRSREMSRARLVAMWTIEP
ncbi:hypothetical protein ACI79C_01950 [Geodermatophilus sp. SYSU D00697]